LTAFAQPYLTPRAHPADALVTTSPAQQVFDKNAFKGDDLIGAAAWALPPPNAPPWKVVRVRLHPPSGGGLPGSAGEAVFSAQRVRLEVRSRAFSRRGRLGLRRAHVSHRQ